MRETCGPEPQSDLIPGTGFGRTCRHSPSRRARSGSVARRRARALRRRVAEDREEGVAGRQRHLRGGPRGGALLRLDRRPEARARRHATGCSASPRARRTAVVEDQSRQGASADRRRQMQPAGLARSSARRPTAAGMRPTRARGPPPSPTTSSARSTPIRRRARSSARSTAPTATRSSTAFRTPSGRRPARGASRSTSRCCTRTRRSTRSPARAPRPT